MSKYVIKFTYSSGSLARMVKVLDDRTTAVRTLVESLGGTLDAMYWDVQKSASYAIAELPDAVAAVAAITAAARTGAFISVEADELLSEHQIHDALMLAKDVSEVYYAPGRAAVEPDPRLAGDGQTARTSA
jgi:uncharacterized protein with GYD domain